MRHQEILAAATCGIAMCGVALGDITLEPGWPVPTGFSVSPSGKAAQMDTDPQLEVVIASQDNKLYVFDHDGTLLPGWPQYMGETLWPDPWVNTNPTPAVVDLDGDGEAEVIVGCPSGRLYVFHRDGTTAPGFPFHADFMIFSTPAMGDIDGDDELEIVFGDNHGYVYALNTDGTHCAGFPYSTPYVVHASPALGDLDGDGLPEIVIAAESDIPDFYAIDGDGSDLPGFPLDLCPNVGIISSPTLADLDLDGSLDIVVGTRDGQIVALDSTGGYKAGFPFDAGYSCQSSPTLVDLDDDPELEIVVGMNDSQVVACNHDGTSLPGWPVATSFTVISSPSVGDVDGDGRLEIVIGENTGKVYGFEIDGTPVSGFPLLDATYTIYSSPLLADLDMDGHLELLVGCNDTWVYCWDLGPATYDPELLPWPEFRGDARNTAVLHRPAYAQIILVPPEAGRDDLIPFGLWVTSIDDEPAEFELWWRVFDQSGPIPDWPTPALMGLTLAPFETQEFADVLEIPPGTAPGEYLAQVYVGSQGVSSFDTASFTFTVGETIPADVNGDGVVDVLDLLLVLSAWGPCIGCPEDINGDGAVDVLDLLLVIANWS